MKNKNVNKMNVNVQGGMLATYSVGAGEPVLFIHGGPGDTHDYMKRMAAPLADQYQCIFFDQRGTGDSNNFSRVLEQYTIEILLQDLTAVQKAYTNKPISLVGHSWGAMYALFACMKTPERFSKAALLNMGPLDEKAEQAAARKLFSTLGESDSEKWMQLRLLRNELLADEDYKAIQEVDQELMHLRVKAWIYTPELRGPFLHLYFKDPPTDRQVNKFIWDSAMNYFSWNDVKSVSTKIWICTGEDDLVPLNQCEKLVGILDPVELTVFSKCGHIPWVDCQKEFYKNLNIFLA